MKGTREEKVSWPAIGELGLIGDRKTIAVLTSKGNIVWYCPDRFDHPSLFAAILDPQKGGSWNFQSGSAAYQRRAYQENSAILQTYFSDTEHQMVLTDFMPVNHKVEGICRRITSVFEDVAFVLEPVPLYGQELPIIELKEGHAVINQKYKFYSSHTICYFSGRLYPKS